MLINCILLYAYDTPNFLMKSTGFVEMGSDVGVDTVVDWDPQVLLCFCLPVTLEPLFNNRWMLLLSLLEPSVQYICSGGHFPNSRAQKTGLFLKSYENQFLFTKSTATKGVTHWIQSPKISCSFKVLGTLDWNEICAGPTLSFFSWTAPRYGKTYKGSLSAMKLKWVQFKFFL